MQDILEKLVSFHTTADDPQSIHEAMDYIATFVANRGMHVERFEADGHEALVALVRPGHKTPKVLLAAHLDVVPAPDEMFVLRQDGDRLYGRGVLDMKFAIAAYLQWIDDHQHDLASFDIGLMITSDEENAGPGTKRLLAEGYQPAVCILPDGGDNWQIQLSSKGFYHLELRRYGTPAHGSRPWLGVNAIVPLMEALHDIQKLFAEPLPENATLNIGTFRGGAVINQVADFAEAAIDIRGSESQKAALLPLIQNICDTYEVNLQIASDGAATAFDLADPLIAPFAAAITAVTGVAVTGSHTLGSNDTRFFTAYAIPCISIYPPGDGHHGSEEWISRQGLHQFGDILDRYLGTIARA